MTPDEINKKIAKWLGWADELKMKNQLGHNVTYTEPWPQYSTSDSEAITLLNELAKRGYYWELWSNTHPIEFGIDLTHKSWRNFDYSLDDDPNVIHTVSNTISAAICAAVILLLEKESK